MSHDTPDFRRIADKIVNTCMNIRPGEVVQLGGGVHNFSLLAALAAAVRRAGAFPELNVTSDELQMELMTTVPIEHLRTVPPHRLRRRADVEAMIVADSVAEPYRAADVAAEAVERKIFERGVRWAYVAWPTPATTKNLLVSFEELWNMYWRAVDIEYSRLAADAALAAARLQDADEVRIVTEKGTDLTFRIGGRPVLVDD